MSTGHKLHAHALAALHKIVLYILHLEAFLDENIQIITQFLSHDIVHQFRYPLFPDPLCRPVHTLSSKY